MAKKYKQVMTEKKTEASRIMKSEQFKKVSSIIHTAAVTSGAAGVIPIPAADAVPITAIQITMVLALGKVFDQKITESAAKGFIGAAAATFVGRNLVKLIPFFGWGISAAVAAGITEAIGWTIAVDLTKNATRTSTGNNNAQKNSFSNDSELQTAQHLSDTTSSQRDQEEVSEINPIDELRERAARFISEGKTYRSHPEDHQKLINDIEKVLDEVPDNDPLREYYDKLSYEF